MGTDELKKSLNEMDVSNVYRHNFLKYFKGMEITSPYSCDGFGVCKIKGNGEPIRVLMEYKHDEKLKTKLGLSKVIAQSIFYIKRFYDKGVKPPTTIFIADIDECLVLHVNDVIKYLDMDLDWSKAPSKAHENTELLTRLVEDENLNPFVFNPSDFEKCLEKLVDLTTKVQRKVLVTDKNITEVFKYFDERVLGKKCKVNTNEKSNLFVQLLINTDGNYLHPRKTNKNIVTEAFGLVPVQSREGFESFFSHFSSSYSPKQKENMTAVVDRLVEDTTRRKQGEFFTPTIWVDKAHEYITSVYGENWKEEYVVWDPAWGTGNLTRDYRFKELYVSTLNQSDIDTANQMGYNSEAVKFQYDFLNDGYDKLPEGLRKAIESGRKIIILMNPPYGTANENSTKEGKQKGGISNTNVKKQMTAENMGKSKEQLYSQFLYRITKYGGKTNLCMFTPPLYLSGSSFKTVRKYLLSEFTFVKGFLMDASNFADVKSWGLSFSILISKK